MWRLRFACDGASRSAHAYAYASWALHGSEVKVVCAFHNVSSVHLKDADHAIDCDVVVCGDAGMRVWHAGALANSAAVEALTSVLIAINGHCRVKASGLRITGLRESP